jgi:hypothetical protein
MKKTLLSIVITTFYFSAAHGANLVVENFDSDGFLAGATPQTGANWNAYTQYSKAGGVLTRTSGTGAIGAGNRLGGTLASGVYDLTATINFAANASPGTGVWGIGYSQTTDVFTSTTTPGGSPWIFMRENGEIAFRALPENNTSGTIIARASSATQPGGAYTIRLSLNTSAALWTVNAFLSINGGAETQLDLNGAAAGSTHTFGTNPTINYVGITSTANAGVGSMDNFTFVGPELIPEPSSAVLSLLGVLGLVTLRKRRD